VLPIKIVAIVILAHSFLSSRWIGESSSNLDLMTEFPQYFCWAYVLLTVFFGGWIVFGLRRTPIAVVEWVVFGMVLLDGVFAGALVLLTGGFNSLLYWLFLGLIARTSISVPRAATQLMLNLSLSTCYVVAGATYSSIVNHLTSSEKNMLEILGDNAAEPLLLRLFVLLLLTFGCYAVQVLLEHRRRAEEEAREFAVREAQLRSVGRLAAEFAHQIKNPLAIINNAAYSLERAGKDEVHELIGMIQEEVNRADLIITDVMGYAQLSEGHVEKLDVLDEMDRAIDRVYPKAARFPVDLVKRYAPHPPALLMQRRHASEAFVNVLQNAREALGEKGGRVEVTVQVLPDDSLRVSIADNGPGIPADKLERIFEPYYSTKEKGTGLGLATVKHNVELYGGTVRVESELGKGARFILVFPAKTSMKVARTT
jgi:signal transduction histidine kinase